MTVSRRKFITGLVALVAAPAVIRMSGVMPINAAQATPFVTVSGVDLSGQPVIYKLWEPTNVNLFAGTAEFRNMAAVHSWTYVTHPTLLSSFERDGYRMNADNRTVDQIIADRLKRKSGAEKAWRESIVWDQPVIKRESCITNTQFNEDGPIKKPWEMP